MHTILVIEDNAANMKLVTLLLNNAGYNTLFAADAEAGIRLARAERPDLILMDLHLPGMDGLAATSLLKQDPLTAAIPVIALTAMASRTDEDNCRAAGCDAFIVKPLRYKILYEAIDRLLAQRAPTTQPPQPQP